MTLENQVTSLELSKRLKELDFKQESLFMWVWNKKSGTPKITNNAWVNLLFDSCSAYTVAELLELCPESTSILKRTDKNGKNKPRYYVETWDFYRKDIYDENLANAVAKLLIYLKENNLI